jgi:hypothetical protein
MSYDSDEIEARIKYRYECKKHDAKFVKNDSYRHSKLPPPPKKPDNITDDPELTIRLRESIISKLKDLSSSIDGNNRYSYNDLISHLIDNFYTNQT